MKILTTLFTALVLVSISASASYASGCAGGTNKSKVEDGPTSGGPDKAKNQRDDG